MNEFSNKPMEDDMSAWNLSAALIAEIQELLSTANKRYMEGSYLRCLATLKGIKMRVIQDLKKEERNMLAKKENHIYGIKHRHRTRTEREVRSLTAFFVERYNETIMDLLERYGFLISKKKDTKRIM